MKNTQTSSKNMTSMLHLKFETIERQIARIQKGEDKSYFTMKQLKAIRDELLVEING